MQKRGSEVDKKLNRLLDLLINSTIAETDYAVRNEQLKQEQREINEQIERHQNGNHEFRDGLTFFLSCSNKFYDEFVKSSNIELKRQILKIMIRTFYIDGGKVEISLRPPFNWIQKKRRKRRFLQMAGVTGLEPATFCVTGRRSNQLSYTPLGEYSYKQQKN